MLAANIVLACETLLVVAGVIWMLAVARTWKRVAGADGPRLGLIQPTGELITAAALSLGAGWAITRHSVPNLLVLALLGIALPARAGMALALMIRQEESPMRSARGWLVLLVPVIGGGTAGLAPHLF
ncbi:hypothetical protein J7F01_00025 [Streptomyces sp. ISL-22]|uniref:hypothetical protein n=1 Tax=unclassified Streptomyces TaxID=2593676 RepID=UPI001BED37EA|nr:MULTISPECIES: hypothetical protein [unclassified Streptomyces]MBT2417015.1 hypothetical protein [Streptomyces sp. ISL-24]MBT2430611.1 hypothetical protein [Streptomyces sp. ISL-22]